MADGDEKAQLTSHIAMTHTGYNKQYDSESSTESEPSRDSLTMTHTMTMTQTFTTKANQNESIGGNPKKLGMGRCSKMVKIKRIRNDD